MSSQIFRIVFEDPAILVVEKCAPFLSQKADRGSSEGLYEFISRTTGTFLIPVHRLDREVLGLMIFAKTKEAAESLSNQFRDRTVSKRYEALVRGNVHKDEDRLEHYLRKNEKTNYVTVFPRETPGAKRAVLSYRVVERLEGVTRLSVELETGRSHQIRAQLAKIGHPIIGDTKYGVSQSEESEIRLRSVHLAIHHPSTKVRMEWTLS